MKKITLDDVKNNGEFSALIERANVNLENMATPNTVFATSGTFPKPPPIFFAKQAATKERSSSAR